MYLFLVFFDVYKVVVVFYEKVLWRDKGGKILVIEIGEIFFKRFSLDFVFMMEF